MTYYGNISNRLNDIFRKHNINIAFYSQNRSKSDLKNQEHITDKNNSSGIYKLNCLCGCAYIGKTFRKFKNRIYEHKYSFKYNHPEKSAYAAHLLNKDHKLMPFNENFEILKVTNDKKKIEIWEQFHIYKHKNQSLLNEHFPSASYPLFKIIDLFPT